MLNKDDHSDVKQYYGEVLTSSKDLKTNACCSSGVLSDEVRSALSLIHPTVLNRFFGCGSPIPPLVTGLTVLDLGCGTGRDSFILSKLVGPEGNVIGIDMTEEQIALAEEHLQHHLQAFGYSKANISFKLGCIEDLDSLGIRDNSIDLVVSNCVINLSLRKKEVFSEIFRVLKPGGELYFSDIFSSRRVPENLSKDPVLRGECLGGALYIQDFRRLLSQLGCHDYRVVSSRPLEIGNKEVEQKIGMVGFSSLTVRAFKLSLEDRCEDYGQVAYYLGTIPGSPHSFSLDEHHHFRTDMPHLICGNTASMLAETRYKRHFRIEGNRNLHFGLFDCGGTVDPAHASKSLDGSCC